MRADPNGITGSAAGGPIAAAPHGPSLLERCQRPLLVHRAAIAAGGEFGAADAAEAGPAVDERVHHEGEELGHDLDRALLSAGHRFSGYRRPKTPHLPTRS